MRPLPPVMSQARRACVSAPLHRVGDQFLMPLAPGAAVIDLRNEPAVLVVAVGVDGAERADAAGERPVAGGDAVGDRHALAAFDQGAGRLRRPSGSR